MPPVFSTGVYAIVHRDSTKVYIGGAYRKLSTRIGQHKSALRADRHFNKHLQSAWNKYGEDAFDFVILERCKLAEVEERETYYIYSFAATNSDYGYNVRPTAASAIGVKRDKETIAKFIEAQNRPEVKEKIARTRGTPEFKELMSKNSSNPLLRAKIARSLAKPEIREKMRQAMLVSHARPEIREKIRKTWFAKGRELTEEQKLAVSKAQKGKPKSLETRTKMAEAAKRRWAENPSSFKKK